MCSGIILVGCQLAGARPTRRPLAAINANGGASIARELRLFKKFTSKKFPALRTFLPAFYIRAVDVCVCTCVSVWMGTLSAHVFLWETITAQLSTLPFSLKLDETDYNFRLFSLSLSLFLYLSIYLSVSF